MGHLGAGNSLPVKLFVKAGDILSATKKAQKFPGVKHDKFPASAKEISKEEYEQGLKTNNYAAFMKAKFDNANLEL